MRAGTLRHECTLQSKQRTPDGMGGGKDEWVQVRKLWADISIPTGRTASVSQQLTAEVTAEIRVRPSPDLIAGRRMVNSGITYLIEAALPDNERSMLRLLCSNVTHP